MEKRAAVAFICGNKYRNFVATRLFDYNRNKYIPYNIQKNMYGFNMFDYDRGSYLNGNDGQSLILQLTHIYKLYIIIFLFLDSIISLELHLMVLLIMIVYQYMITRV